MPSTIRLFYRTNAPARRGTSTAAPLLSTANVSTLYFPSKGVIFSLLFHFVIFLILVFRPVPHPDSLLFQPHRPDRLSIIFIEPKSLMYLPMLGGGSGGGQEGGSRGGGQPLGGSDGGKKGPEATSAKRKPGMVYPGRQRIVSNPPDPTNTVQTLLQPGIEKPPVLKPNLQLPNFVQMADAGPAPKLDLPAPPTPEPEPAPPTAPEPAAAKQETPPPPPPPPLPPMEVVKPTVEIPTMLLPTPSQEVLKPQASAPEIMETRPRRPRKAPEPEKLTPTRDTLGGTKEPAAPELAPVATRGKDSRNVLALSPMPALGAQPIQLPEGEARARFAVSPEPSPGDPNGEPGDVTPSKNTTVHSAEGPAGANGTDPGKGGGGTSGDSSGLGPGAGTGVGAGFSPGPASGPGGGTGAGRGTGSGAGVGPGSGTGLGTGKGAGLGPGTGSGTGSVTGTGSGTAIGSGSGTGVGSGTGAGSGPGRSPFAGITIVGGVGPTGSSSSNPSNSRMRPAPRPLQTNSYGVTVVSTESSGGGLPFSGVFSQEQIYTVYLDMRRTEIEQSPSWTLEFAVVEGVPGPAPQLDPSGANGLVLPFPTTKELPVLPVDIVRRYAKKMVIVYGIVNLQGRIEQLTIKDSPDTALNAPVLSCLAKWVFRPARLYGRPIAMKLLLGIALSNPE